MDIIFRLLRIKQWVKNLIIFAPLFFSGQYICNNKIFDLIITIIHFSFITSFIYILNDINDVNHDKNHPTKKLRPIASGEVSIKQAFILAIILLITGIWGLKNVFELILLYIIINLLYIYFLKNFALIDILFIAIGYVLRLYIGANVSSTELHPWIIIMTFLLALFLSTAKRYDDLKYGISVRTNMKGYNCEFLSCMLTILATIIVVAYILYTVSPAIIEQYQNDNIYLTSLFVLLGVLRYLQITFVYKKSGSPTNIIYSDLFIKIIVLSWFMSFICIIYL